MIRLVAIDLTAEARGKLLDQLDVFMCIGQQEFPLIPRISLKAISPQESKFHAAPDLCLLGPELMEKDITEVARIKKLYPNSVIVAWLGPSLSNLNMIEQVARYGADDVLTYDVTAQYFYQRVLLLSRKVIHQSSGKLVVVDGGKGGVGVTTIAAALAECVNTLGRRVVIVDCDFETQDCSRFLQARPFLNENLKLLLEEERAVTEESVEECLNLIWEDDNSIRCMPPIIESEELYNSNSQFPRTYLSILEVLDHKNDVVVIDIGSAHGALRKMFYRIADKLIFVVNDDPASMYASVDKLARIRSCLSAGAQLCVVENCIGIEGLGNKLLRKEFSRAARLDNSHWSSDSIPFCSLGKRWPGSGSTLFTQAKSTVAKSFCRLAASLNIIDDYIAKPGFVSWFSKFLNTASHHNQFSNFQENLSDNEKIIHAGCEIPLKLIEERFEETEKIVCGQTESLSSKLEKLQTTSLLGKLNFIDSDLESLVKIAKPV